MKYKKWLFSMICSSKLRVLTSRSVNNTSEFVALCKGCFEKEENTSIYCLG